MNLSKKNLLSAVIFAVILFVTVSVYFLIPFKKEAIDWITFIGMITAQTLSFVAVMIFNTVTSKKRLALSAGSYTAILIYVCVSMGLSILFSAYYRNAPKTYFIIEIMVTAVFIISLIFIYLIGSKIAIDGKKSDAENHTFKVIESNLELMRGNPKNIDYKDFLNKIYEAYKSSDQSNYVVTDEKIKEKIYDLNSLLQSKATNLQQISELCELILQLIKQRNMEVNQLKLGGI